MVFTFPVGCSFPAASPGKGTPQPYAKAAGPMEKEAWLSLLDQVLMFHSG